MEPQVQRSHQHAKLIVLDGGDNAGKATQAALLLARLQKEGKKTATLDFPRYVTNTLGALIKECLNGSRGDFLHIDPKIASTLYAADRFESKETLLALLAENDVVILDRYVSANMLHQGAKIHDKNERIAFLEWLEHVEYEIFGMPRPDLTIALYVSPQHSDAILNAMVTEGKKTADVAESDREHQKLVTDCLTWLSKVKENWVEVHCSGETSLRSREDIHEELYSLVKTHL